MLLFIVLLVNVAFGAGFYCNFDNGYCGGTNRNDDKFDWWRRNTPTGSKGTGPDSGYGGLGKGIYAYIETSSPRKTNENAKLEFRPPLGNGASCISFYYHMWGRDVGKLIVYVNGKQEFMKTGNQQNKWHKADIKVPERASKVIFEGVRGSGWQGDIAIDELKIVNCGSAQPPVTPAAKGGCGIRPSTRIVGGTSAQHGDWPWQAMLRNKYGHAFCGGTLVAPQWVVTATHCLRGKKPDSVFVRLGAHRRTYRVGTEQDFQVSKVITHPSYSKPISYSYDIALLKLDKPAVLGRYVNLACLPHSVNAPVDGDTCWITGWGRLAYGGSTPTYLQQVSVPVVSRARCDKAYPRKIHDSMICAGLEQGGKDACQGDSGGPMVCQSGGRYYLQGATSWGNECAKPGKFGVYAKVKYLMSWITSKMSTN